MRIKEIESVTAKANATMKDLTRLTTDISKANAVQIKRAIEKSFIDYDKIS
jgi:hypothetical protein